MTPTIVLFDVDGTLVLTGGAGRRAIEHAFGEVTGHRDACDDLAFGGLTDRAIMRHGLGVAGLEATDTRIDALIAAYVAQLPAEVDASADYRIMPGVEALLSRLQEVEGLALGLGTGNVETGARHKLRRGGLFEHFAFGGYGSDHEDRPTLIGIGADRGAARLGRSRSDCRVVVVGDTPRDVEAAHAIGATCLAVATGSSTVEELRASGAEVVVEDLTRPGAWEVLVIFPG